MPEFLSLHRWDHDLMMSRLRALIMREQGDDRAAAVMDQTSVPRKGDDAVGVKRQHRGQSGKMDHCMVTVHRTCARGPFSGG